MSTCENGLMLIQTVQNGFPCNFLAYVDPEKDNLIYKDLLECKEMGMAVNISLSCPGFREGNELIQAWTQFFKTNCVDSNYINTNVINLPAIAKASWWVMYSIE